MKEQIVCKTSDVRLEKSKSRTLENKISWCAGHQTESSMPL